MHEEVMRAAGAEKIGDLKELVWKTYYKIAKFSAAEGGQKPETTKFPPNPGFWSDLRFLK